MLYPLNVYSIEDVQKWREDFFYPISMQEIYDAELSIYHQVIPMIRSHPPRERVAMRICLGWMVTQLIEWISSIVCAHRLRDCSCVDLVFTNIHKPPGVPYQPSHNLLELIKGKAPRFDYYDIFRDNTTARTAKNIVPRIRQAVSRYKQQITRCPVGLFTGNILAVNPNRDTISYLNTICVPYRIIPSSMIVSQVSEIDVVNHYVPATFHNAAEGYAGIVDACCKDIFGIVTDSYLRNFFIESIYRLLKLIDLDLANARMRSHILKDREIVTGTGGNYFTRIISQVAREVGGHVLGFPHGGSSTCIYWPKFTFSELELTSEFAVYDQLEATELRRYESVENTPGFRLVKTGIPSLLRVKPGVPRPELDFSAVKTVMCVSHGYFGDMMQSQLIPQLLHFHLELMLIDFFLAQGKRVIYKLRPKTASYGSGFDLLGVYKNRSVLFEDRPFSTPEVLESADMFVFTKVASTALWEAMYMTEKPVVLFHPDIPKLTEPFLAQDRIHFVKIAQDERNRFLFDEDDFFAQVNR